MFGTSGARGRSGRTGETTLKTQTCWSVTEQRVTVDAQLCCRCIKTCVGFRFMSSTALTGRGSRRRVRLVLDRVHSSTEALNIFNVFFFLTSAVKHDYGVCSGAGGAAGRGEAERGPGPHLRQQAGPADGRPCLRDRRGAQPAHHPRPHLADPGVLRPLGRGHPGQHLDPSIPRPDVTFGPCVIPSCLFPSRRG